MKKTLSLVLVILMLFSVVLPFSAEPAEKTKAQIVREFTEGVQIGSYNTPKIDSEDDVRLMAENGINFVLLFKWCVRGDYEQAISWCEKYNIRVLIDDIWPQMSDADIRTALHNDHTKSPAVIGHYIADEPNAADYARLAQVVAIYKEEQPDMIPYINLLPQYATSSQFGTSTFDEYIRSFVSTVGTGYVSTDVYPLEATTRKNYITSLATVQRACLESNLDIWMFIQGVAHMGYRRVSYEDFLSQNYIALSMGVTKIMNFCYATPVDWNVTEKYYQASVTADGEKTELYDITKKVNDEISLLAPALSKYKNVGSFALPPQTGRPSFQIVAYTDEFEQYSGFNSLFKTLQSERSALVGCYEAKSGSGKAFLLANATELTYKQTSEVTFSFNTPKLVTAYPDGVKTVLEPDENGVYTLSLGIGGGVFVETSDLSFVRGDVNSDGSVSLLDAMLSFMHVAGKTALSYPCRAAADLDGNGTADIADATKLFLIIAGKDTL